MDTGLRLRQIRERLGLTYRDVERASLELASSKRGRPDFILHISRRADIENHCVIPGIQTTRLQRSTIWIPCRYSRWYDVPSQPTVSGWRSVSAAKHASGRTAGVSTHADSIRSGLRSTTHGIPLMAAAVGTF